ncbi:MAG: hypothetical protein CL933_23055 [Deltaproteobacteria bacterium]|nr:hypothetical protein [Deltaproteobacteria bacterium]
MERFPGSAESPHSSCWRVGFPLKTIGKTGLRAKAHRLSRTLATFPHGVLDRIVLTSTNHPSRANASRACLKHSADPVEFNADVTINININRPCGPIAETIVPSGIDPPPSRTLHRRFKPGTHTCTAVVSVVSRSISRPLESTSAEVSRAIATPTVEGR